MVSDTLRVALVGGPMYDHHYARLRDHDVEVVVHEDHPTLNRWVAELLAAGERIDVLATHSKYAPSQREWLRPLDGLLDPTAIAESEIVLDMEALGMSAGDVFLVHDEITGQSWRWGQRAFVRLTFDDPAHILTVVRQGDSPHRQRTTG